MKTLVAACLFTLVSSSIVFARESEPERHSGSGGREQRESSGAPRSSRPNVRANNLIARFANDTGERYPQGSLSLKAEGRRGVLTKVPFKAKAEVRVPSTVPPVANLNDADSLDVVLELSRQGAPYARCQLELESVEDEHGGIHVEYKVDLETSVKRGRARTRLRSGGCDSDLSVPGMENTIPAIQKGDTAVILGNGAPFLHAQM